MHTGKSKLLLTACAGAVVALAILLVTRLDSETPATTSPGAGLGQLFVGNWVRTSPPRIPPWREARSQAVREHLRDSEQRRKILADAGLGPTVRSVPWVYVLIVQEGGRFERHRYLSEVDPEVDYVTHRKISSGTWTVEGQDLTLLMTHQGEEPCQVQVSFEGQLIGGKLHLPRGEMYRRVGLEEMLKLQR